MTRTLQRQFLIKITPLRVVLLDQLQFPGAPPSLDPLLPNDGILERAIASVGEDVDARALVAHAEQLPGSPLSRGRRYKGSAILTTFSRHYYRGSAVEEVASTAGISPGRRSDRRKILLVFSLWTQEGGRSDRNFCYLPIGGNCLSANRRQC